MIFIMNLSLPYASFSHTIPTAIRTFFKLCEALVALPDLDEGSDGLRIESVFFEEDFDFFPGVGVVLSAILVLDDELDGEVGSLRIGDFCVLFGGVVAEPDPVVVGVADVEAISKLVITIYAFIIRLYDKGVQTGENRSEQKKWSSFGPV